MGKGRGGFRRLEEGVDWKAGAGMTREERAAR